jgi:exosortase
MLEEKKLGFSKTVTFAHQFHLFESVTGKTGAFLVMLSSTLMLLWQPLLPILLHSLQDEGQSHYSHIVLIPFLSLLFLYMERKEVFEGARGDFWLGAIIMLAGVVFFQWAGSHVFDVSDAPSSVMFSIVLVWWGAFIFCYGLRTFQKASFALFFLLCMVPLPASILNAIVVFLQQSSAEITDLLFSVLGIPVFREGFVFSLSSFTIHVAEECSGIRSALSLFIASLVAGHFFLRSTWAKMGLMAIVIPLAIIKNAFRIVGLALLANYVDPSFITDNILHRSGGIPLFFVALAVLGAFVWLLRWAENRTPSLVMGLGLRQARTTGSAPACPK